jgi:hypothetical protein
MASTLGYTGRGGRDREGERKKERERERERERAGETLSSSRCGQQVIVICNRRAIRRRRRRRRRRSRSRARNVK